MGDCMEVFKILFLIFVGICFFIILIFGILSKKLIRILLLNAVLGIMALVIINLTSKFTHTFIPVNQLTVSGCSLFGIPAVCLFLILQVIFI